MKVTVTIETDGTYRDEQKLAAMFKALGQFPPEGHVISKGPVTVHTSAEHKDRANAWLKVLDPDVEIDNKTTPEPCPEPVEEVSPEPAVKKEDPVEEVSPEPAVKKETKPEPAPEPSDEVEELKKEARGLMLNVTKNGTSVADLKKALAAEIDGDLTKLVDPDQLQKAIDIMKGLL